MVFTLSFVRRKMRVQTVYSSYRRGQYCTGRHRHLQIGRMLDIDLIPDLTQKVDNFQRSSLRKVRAFYLYLSSNSRSYLWNCSTFDHRSLGEWEGGEECIKPHMEVIIFIFESWTQTLRHSNTVQGADDKLGQTLQPYLKQ